MKHLLLCTTLGTSLLALPAVAGNTALELQAHQEHFACAPHLKYTKVVDGKIVHYAPRDEVRAARTCLQKAQIDPYPVNMTGVKQATRVYIRADGTIVLE